MTLDRWGILLCSQSSEQTCCGSSRPDAGVKEELMVKRRPIVSISIATFRRPEGLRILLHSINDQIFEGPEPDVRIVVVDNDADAPIHRSHGRVEDWCRFPVTYVVEAERGIDSARNRGLNTVAPESDFVVFIDDDERATPTWLDSLLRTQRQTGAAVVQGPVTPEYEVEPEAWLTASGLYQMGPYEEGQTVLYAATNNTLVSKQAIDRARLRFDQRFNLNGGGDHDFFDRLVEAGFGPMVGSADAHVIETVPASRTQFSWIVRRHFRIGNSLGLISRLRGGPLGMTERVIKSVGRVVVGTVKTVLGTVSSRALATQGIGDVAWGLGALYAVSGFDYQEYRARPEYASAVEPKISAPKIGAPKIAAETTRT
ncbi:MAG: glycosyltransferase [Pseudomonadota bacterium]